MGVSAKSGAIHACAAQLPSFVDADLERLVAQWATLAVDTRSAIMAILASFNAIQPTS
jgi:hypothetical protein